MVFQLYSHHFLFLPTLEHFEANLKYHTIWSVHNLVYISKRQDFLNVTKFYLPFAFS